MSNPEPAIDAPKPKPSAADAYVLFFLVMALAIVVGTPLQLMSLRAGLVLTEILLILLPAVLYVRMKRLPVAEGLRWKPIPLGLAARAAAVGVTGWGAAMLVSAASHAVVNPILGPDPASGFTAGLFPDTWAAFALILVVGAVLPGFCEEALLRGAIQGRLERKGAWKAVAIAALLFAVLHLSPWNFLPLLALGVLFGTLSARTNSTLTAAVGHGCNNATAFGAVFAFGGHPDGVPTWFIAVLAVLFVPALAEFLRHTRSIERTRSPLAEAPAGARVKARYVVIGLAVGVPVLLVCLVATARMFIAAYPVRTNDLSPRLEQGDRVIVLKSRWSGAKIQPDDIIAARREGRVSLYKVAKADEESVWVVQTSSDNLTIETAVPRADVIGRMLYRISMKELKQ